MADTDSVYRYALYIGSFAVSNSDLHDRTVKIQKELEQMRVFERSKCVGVCISTRGVKICSEDFSTVYMAHALRRISYATCDALHRQVALVAREPTIEASLQYCHVFVAETPSQAEELNRIVGDAFQLAYLWQRLGKQHPETPAPDATPDRIPRLCDLHSQWPSSVHSSTPMRSVLTVLDLPPPPTYPPSPPTHQDVKATEIACTPSVVPLNTGHRASDDFTTDIPPNNGSHPSSTSDGSDERPRRISAPQATETGGFRRRHFLRPEGVERRLSGIADAQILGGSTRQPKRRQGLGWTSLFASTRHSAFIPTTHVLKETEPPALLELLNAQKSPHKPQIFVDLRTFAGGSPVVALKERLDAQAVANAKASAFAEAAAVLAAAKQASAHSTAGSQDSVTPVPNGISTKIKPDPYPPPTPISPSSITSTHSEPNQVTHLPNGSTQSPPTPPLRIHSLRRSEGLVSSTAPQKHVVSNPVPGRLYTPVSSNGSGADSPTVINHPNCDSPMCSSQAAIGNGYLHNRTKTQATELSETPFHSVHASEPPAASPNKSSVALRSPRQEDMHRSSVAVADQRSRLSFAAKPRRSLWPTTSVPQDQHHPVFANVRPSYKPHRSDKSPRPREHPVFTSPQAPLHVAVARVDETSTSSVMSDFTSAAIASLPGWSAAPSGKTNGASPSVMSSSTISAETPTPTATPTPTPTQTPQPIQHANSSGPPACWPGSRDEWMSLKQAPWFQGLLPRELAFELLAQKEVGSFLVRNSATHPDCFALSVRVPTPDNSSGITHYLIQHTPRGVRLKGLDKEWPSLHALITHLTVIPEMLPCPLRLSACTSNPIFTQADDRPFVRRCKQSNLEHNVNGSGMEDNQIECRNVCSTDTQRTQALVALSSRFTPSSSTSGTHQLTTTSHNLCERRVHRHGVQVCGDQSRSNSFPEHTGSGSSHVHIDQRRSNSLGTDGTTQPLSSIDVATSEVATGHMSVCEIKSIDLKDGFLNDSFSVQDVPEASAIADFDGGDNEEDEEYQRLSDFSSILADLRVTT